MKNPAAQQLGRLGGLAKSKAKTAAVRANGRLGGRPKKPKRAARLPNDPELSHACRKAGVDKPKDNQ